MQLCHVAVKGGRLSTVLREELKISLGLMNKLKWQDRLLVNDIPRRTDYPVEPGDVVRVLLAEPEPEYPPQEGDLSILYEDAFLLAVDKPAGMLIHPSRSRFTDTLANFVLGYYRRTGQESAFHPLTRLDRDTYGVVLLAKNAHVHNLLQELQVEKFYHALVLHGPDADAGQIDAPIDRRPAPSLLRYVSPTGKPCLTRYQVLKRQGESCLLQLQPVTGRTHQLRVHCAHMGFPILGDPQYGSPESMALSAQLGYQTQRLCAKKLILSHPITAEPLMLTSPMDV